MMEWFVSSSVLILALLALRAALKGRLSLRVRYALWLVVAVRLLVPFQPFSAPVNVGQAATVLSERLEETDLYAIPVKKEELPEQHIDLMRENVGKVIWTEYSERRFEPFDVRIYTGCGVLREDGVVNYALYAPAGQLLRWVWALGTLIVLVWLLRVDRRLSRRLAARRRPLERPDCKLPVYVAEGLSSPCLYGLFRPAIYLTPEAAEDETALRHILAHENTHYAHGDHIWAALRCVCLALHWYNPLVWVAAFLSKRDGELACDEGAVARLGEGERISYGRTLVGLTAQRGSRPADLLTCSTAMTEGHKTIQQRVALLVKAPKTRKAALVLALILAAAAAVFAFSKGREPEPTEYETFLAQVAEAQSIRVAEPAYSSQAYPAAIVDEDLLDKGKALLRTTRMPTRQELQRDWGATAVDFGVVALGRDIAGEADDGYYLGCSEEYVYLLIEEEKGPGYVPVAVLNAEHKRQLFELSRQQEQRDREREEKWIELPDRVASALGYLAADEAFLEENARLWSVTPEEVARWLTDDTAGAYPMELTLRYGSFDLPELEEVAPCWHLICWDGEGQLSYILYLPEEARQTLGQWCSDVDAPRRVVQAQFDEMGLLHEGASYSIWDIVRKLEATYVVARYTPAEGEGRVWLFVLEASKGALKARYRFNCPISQSMGVEVCRVSFPGRTVIYGAVGDRLWTDLDAAPKKVEFTGVQALYGQEEQTVVVKNNSAFLICLPGKTEIDDIVFLTGEGEAGRLSELPISEDPIGNLNTSGSPYTPHTP